MIDNSCVDLMYLACNRLEFTKETFVALLKNTDWHLVHELFIYDDGSQDGTREWLDSHIGKTPVPTRFLKTNFGSPVAAMVHFIESAQAPILAKTDNDAMLPPAWLRSSLEVLERHPELSLLGIEAMYPHENDVELTRTYEPAKFISGLGLYRRKAFTQSRPVPYQKWFGFEQWQVSLGSELQRGWITPAIPVFLLDRIPFEPWISYSDSYERRSWQRSWPKYGVNSTIWGWRWPSLDGIERLVSNDDSDSRFLCAMRIKNEAHHISEVLSSTIPLCRRILVFDDHSTDKTVEICRSFGERVKIIQSPFTGLDEARDKNYLLKKIIRANPEWVLWIDGDEVLENKGPHKLKLAAKKYNKVAAFYIHIAYLWHDTQHVRVDGIFGQFKRLSFFRLKDQPVGRLFFPASGRGGNFHCGNVPTGLVGEFKELNVRMKHYGYMTKDKRQAKFKWYSTIDPNNTDEDNYRHLADTHGARFAPGPPKIIPWTE